MSHPYHCYTEITRQAEAWQEGVDAVLAQSAAIRSFFDEMQAGEIIFAGCTSPYYVGISAAAYWQSALGIHTKAVTCSELIQFPASFISTRQGKPVLVIISRSGKTTESLLAVDQFEKRFPGRTLYIGCAPESQLAQTARLSILFPKGYEETLAQTRSFSTMFLTVQMIGALLSGQEETLKILKAAPAVVERIVRGTEPSIANINQGLSFQNIFYLGSGPFYGAARDAALKMMEMSISEVLCFPFLESRHGPKSLIDENSLVIGLFSQAGRGYEAQLMDEYTIKHRATTVALIPDATCDPGRVSYRLPVGCLWPDSIQALAYLPVVQLMAYYRALAKGVNPDLSRNLTQFIEIARI